MTLFAWLVLAHFVGDWMLQNDWMARAKRGRWWSSECLVHCAVYTGVLTLTFGLASRPSGAPTVIQLLLFAASVFLSHWVIDGANLPYYWSRLINQSDLDFVRIVVDQTMHLVVLAALVEWIVS